jgi:hypothetical protein
VSIVIASSNRKNGKSFCKCVLEFNFAPIKGPVAFTFLGKRSKSLYPIIHVFITIHLKHTLISLLLQYVCDKPNNYSGTPSNDALTLLSWRDFGGSRERNMAPGSPHKFSHTGKRGGGGQTQSHILHSVWANIIPIHFLILTL